MFWDFQANDVAGFLMDYYGFDRSLIADIKPTFGEQGRVNAWAAKELGLREGIPVTYRAGDQPNNALSLNVFNPGEIASTAGTSGVVYGVNGEVNYDPKSRVNTFCPCKSYCRADPSGSVVVYQWYRYIEFVGET